MKVGSFSTLFRNVTLLVPPLYLLLRLHQCPPVFSIMVITEQTEDFPRDRWILVLQTPAWCLTHDTLRSKLLSFICVMNLHYYIVSLFSTESSLCSLPCCWEAEVWGENKQLHLLMALGNVQVCSRCKWCRVGEVMYGPVINCIPNTTYFLFHLLLDAVFKVNQSYTTK